GQRFDLPRLLGKSTHHAAAVYAWQNGEGMDALLGQALADSGKVAEVGGALAELHGQSGSSLPELSASDLARQLPEHARVIAWLSPSCTDRAHTLAAHLAVRLRNAPTAAGALHGDFYAKQVLFDGTRLVFLDLDSASRGPGWVDLANFIAHLELDVIRERYPADTARAVSEALVEGYARVSPPGRDLDLSSPVAAALFAQAPHLFRSRVENWSEKLSRLLDRVSELAHTPGRVPRAHSAVAAVPTACAPQPTPAVQAESALADPDPAMPTLRSALDTVGMEARFRRMPGLSAELEGHTLVSAVVRRHKAGRRALIEYRFEADEGLGAFSWLGKVRAKSGRDWSDRVSRALRAAGLAEPSCVAVPEAMGTLSDLNLELQRRVAGDAVTRLLLWPEAPALAARCAEAISRLHASRVVVPRSHTVADEWRVLEERLERLETSHPHHASRVARLRRACAELAEAIPAAQPTLIHRDFYPDQVLVDGRRLWLLDLDFCTMGDPCVDHGNFLAHLTEWSLRTLGRADALRACEAAYREAALKSVGPGGAFRLEVYQTLSLARHVQLCTQFPERREWLPFLLELCEQRLSRPVRTLCC
ncbi:MAG: hypothetical protein IT580_08355, partial [Verrucomicrobiales bacterium]|nr:hypothetical protein [Verrucomicrobiales bacterium]